MRTPLRLIGPALAAVFLLAAGQAQAQLSYGGVPPSATLQQLRTPPTQSLSGLDRSVFVLENLDEPKHQPLRFGEPKDVRFDLSDSGVWEELSNGSRLWRLRISSPGARSLNLIFGKYRLPDGAELYLYDDQRSTLLGSFNALNNKPNGQFAVEPIFADAINLEYLEPAWVEFPGELRVDQVVHGFRDIRVYLQKSGSGSGPGCETDVNCPQGLGWENQIASVARIVNGGSLCTGSLINNTSNDGTQFFVTAAHCGDITNSVFFFNYQNDVCGVFGISNTGTVSGSQLVVIAGGNDTRLVILSEDIPPSFGVYYNGWDRSGVVPANTVTIHHPRGEPKKISFDNDPPARQGIDWHVLQWDLGVTEPGSSGSPLFDPAGRFIGQLWGGAATCSFPFDDFYRRFDLSASVLGIFLDAAGTGQQVLDGFDPNACPLPTTFGVGEVGSLGSTASLSSQGGLPQVGNPNFAIRLSGVRPNMIGAAMAGQGVCSLVMPYGTILIVEPRFFWSLFFNDPSGGFTTSFPVTAGMAGQTWNVQFATRDPGFGGGVQLSDGMAITFCP